MLETKVKIVENERILAQEGKRTSLKNFVELCYRIKGRKEIYDEEFELLYASYQLLTRNYTDPSRKYHNFEHIARSLEELDKARKDFFLGMNLNPDAIEFALWYHDAVHLPGNEDNESFSALSCYEFCLNFGLGKDFAKKVYNIILATKHNQKARTDDEKVICDLDLAGSFGKPPEEFEEYSRAIEQEYLSPGLGYICSRPLYLRRRIAFVDNMLARENIFSTKYFQEKYEERARANLARHKKQLQEELSRASCNLMDIYGLNEQVV